MKAYKKSFAEHYSFGLIRFIEEAQTLAKFSGNPNIVWVKDYFEANGTAYIVMDYLEGTNLMDFDINKIREKPMIILLL